jgi:hypothetical protein
MVQGHGVDMHRANYDRLRSELKDKILAVENGEKIFEKFDAMTKR